MLHECRPSIPLRHLLLIFNKSSYHCEYSIPRLMKCTGQRVPKLDARLPHGKHLPGASPLRVLLLVLSYTSSFVRWQLLVDALSRLAGECLMYALRQGTRLLRRNPLQQARAAHQDSTAVDTEHRVDGEIGIASGAPEAIYKRQVYLSDLSCSCAGTPPVHILSLHFWRAYSYLASDAGHHLFPSTHFWPAREGQHRRCFRQWAQLEAHLRDAAEVSSRSLRFLASPLLTKVPFGKKPFHTGTPQISRFHGIQMGESLDRMDFHSRSPGQRGPRHAELPHASRCRGLL